MPRGSWTALALLAGWAGSAVGCGSVLQPASDPNQPCPAGQVQCTTCELTRYCSNACPGYVCPPLNCAGQATVELCDARTDCHSVFVDAQDCRCGGLGCCARFSRCADGDKAKCSPGAIACDALAPHCEGEYVVGYTDACYEGCVRMTECAP